MRYTKLLAEALGLIIYGIAQVNDEPLDEVFAEARRILIIAENRPERLFKTGG